MQISKIITDTVVVKGGFYKQYKNCYIFFIDGFIPAGNRSGCKIKHKNDKTEYLYNVDLDDMVDVSGLSLDKSFNYWLKYMNEKIKKEYNTFLNLLKLDYREIILNGINARLNKENTTFTLSLQIKMSNRNTCSGFLCTIDLKYPYLEVYKNDVIEEFKYDIDIFNEINLNYMLRDYLV